MATATMTQDELDTFHKKFERFAEELSSRELAFLRTILSGAAGDGTEDVEGHLFDPTVLQMHAELLHHLGHLLAILHHASHHGAAIPLPQHPTS